MTIILQAWTSLWKKSVATCQSPQSSQGVLQTGEGCLLTWQMSKVKSDSDVFPLVQYMHCLQYCKKKKKRKQEKENILKERSEWMLRPVWNSDSRAFVHVCVSTCSMFMHCCVFNYLGWRLLAWPPDRVCSAVYSQDHRVCSLEPDPSAAALIPNLRNTRRKVDMLQTQTRWWLVPWGTFFLVWYLGLFFFLNSLIL